MWMHMIYIDFKVKSVFNACWIKPQKITTCACTAKIMPAKSNGPCRPASNHFRLKNTWSPFRWAIMFCPPLHTVCSPDIWLLMLELTAGTMCYFCSIIFTDVLCLRWSWFKVKSRTSRLYSLYKDIATRALKEQEDGCLQMLSTSVSIASCSRLKFRNLEGLT